MKAEWARQIRDQCVRKGVPFFFKQWGGVNKKKAGRVLDDKLWDQRPVPLAEPGGGMHVLGLSADRLAG